MSLACEVQPMECDTSSPHLDREVAEKHKGEGNAAFKSQDYKKAKESYSQAIYHCPGCAVYYGNRSACLMMMNNYKAALEDCTMAIKLDESFTKGYLRAGKCHLMLGNPSLSIDYYHKVLQFEKGNRQAQAEMDISHKVLQHLERAQSESLRGEHRTAVFYLGRCLEEAPTSSTFKTLKAEALMFSRLYDEAHSLANDLMRADSNNADAVYVKAMCYYYQDVQDKAKLFFQRALKMDPDHSKSREAMKKTKLLLAQKEQGNAAFHSGQFQQAHNLYTEALQIDPLNVYTNAKFYFNRALMESKLGNLKQAIADCTEAIKLDENYVKAYQRRANLYQSNDQHDEAVWDWEKVCRLERSHENEVALRDAKRLLKASKRKNLYKILGIEKSASCDDIKRAYRKLAMKHHPDRHSQAEAEVREEEEKKFKEVSSAYSILSDTKKRSRYDDGHDLDDLGGDMGGDAADIFSSMFGFGGSPFGGGGHRAGGGSFFFQGPGGVHFEF